MRKQTLRFNRTKKFKNFLHEFNHRKYLNTMMKTAVNIYTKNVYFMVINI